MELKVCSKCGESKPNTLEYWHKQKNAKDGIRATCKICSCNASKLYRSKPENKEKIRIKQAKWVTRNPEKVKAIDKKCRYKNKDKYNLTQRDKYKNDSEYKQKCIDLEKKYKASGRRYEVNHKPETMEKARIRSKKRRNNPIKKAQDYARNDIWREKNHEYILECDRKKRDGLAPSYIAQTLGINVEDLTPEILETKQLIIKLKRELKTNNVKIK